MDKKRTVVIFGAGAAIDWGGPKTDDITTLIRNSGFWAKDGKTRITEFLYQRLLESGFSANEINFETIFYVLEELISYYAKGISEKKCNSILECFFSQKFEKEILNFKELPYSGRFKIAIPGIPIDQSPISWHNETPEQLYFQELFQTLLTNVYMEIEKYGFHTLNNSNVIIKKNEDLNKLFCNWISKIKKEGVVRLYTLNYERNFKIILEKELQMRVFEGFEAEADINYEDRITANTHRILIDFDSHCHYNLHGSIFWDIESENSNGFFFPQYFLRGYPNLPINNNHPTSQSEKSKTILLSNFIAGYQKLQKGAITPFRQMKYALERDCISADEIYIIGYSFGDEHINSAIGEAVRTNPNIRLIFVDPSFQKNDLKIIIATLGHYSHELNPSPKTIRVGLEHEFNSEKIKAYTMTFKEFLIEQTEPPHLKHMRVLAK